MLRGRQRGIEPGEDERATRQGGHRPQQLGGRRDRSGGAGGDHRPLAVDLQRGIRVTAQAKIADHRGIGLSGLGEMRRPGRKGDLEKFEHPLPILGERFRRQVAQGREGNAFDRQVVDELTERIGEPDDFGGIGWSGQHRSAVRGPRPGVDQPRQRQPALGGTDRVRKIRPVHWQERLFVGHLAAERPDIGQKPRATRHERLGERDARPGRRQDDGDVGEPEWALARPAAQQRAVEHAFGKGRQERRMGRDRIEPSARRDRRKVEQVRLVGGESRPRHRRI